MIVFLSQSLQKTVMHIGPMPRGLAQFGGSGHQCPPQFGLPGLVLSDLVGVDLLLPLVNPVGTVNQVLVEDVGDFARELKFADILRIIRKVLAEGGKVRVVFQLVQQVHQFPGHGLFVKC